MTHYFSQMVTPLGQLTLIATDNHLVEVRWESMDRPRDHLIESPSHMILSKTECQLREYFDGKRIRFDLPLSFHGTDFQMRVWKQLQQIPFGVTRSYSELATRVGSPKACRAVGAANGKNPLSIIVPCHRVVGKKGDLTGFAGGLENKAFLLELEGIHHEPRSR